MAGVRRIKAGTESDGLILCSHWEPGGEVWLEVVHAEPRALFSGPLLRKVRRGEARPFTEMTGEVKVGGIIRIRGRGRTLVYRITEELEYDTWAAEWPD